MVVSRGGRESTLGNRGRGAGSKNYEATGGGVVQWEPGDGTHISVSLDAGSETSDARLGE